ncbi:hypothetical protein DRW41_03885 [Neobacillus piezotolerans]|uniref:Uncharacterized protein n=1 Tax=Neobacillus piezotolerans TaxID=2259171 RepID=A0A3D8GW69_9BACI|nr:ankyrin repeat domain-containing protein [Neobacillus piezotolerans]RDU38708.1 hypothetical protein DRW41_03885 [Neobacillus piezotolerans]
MVATQNNRIDVVKVLLEAGNDVNTRDITLLTPFICEGETVFTKS